MIEIKKKGINDRVSPNATPQIRLTEEKGN